MNQTKPLSESVNVVTSCWSVTDILTLRTSDNYSTLPFSAFMDTASIQWTSNNKLVSIIRQWINQLSWIPKQRMILNIQTPYTVKIINRIQNLLHDSIFNTPQHCKLKIAHNTILIIQIIFFLLNLKLAPHIQIKALNFLENQTTVTICNHSNISLNFKDFWKNLMYMYI